MHKQNSDYGHKAILASACRMLDERPIWGILQHGWTPQDGWSPTNPLPSRLPRYVWSKANLERVPSHRSPARYEVVGSPFAYAVRDGYSIGKLDPSRGGKILAFPVHSSESTTVQGDHVAYAELLARREAVKVTVCLYWLDHANKAIRTAYESAGHEVVTLGATRRDRLFIPRWLRGIDGAAKLISNRVSTAVMYAASLGLPVEIYGEPMVVPEEDGAVENASAQGTWDGETLRPSREWAEYELGFDSLLAPKELRALLGWAGPRLVLGGIADSFLIGRSVRRSRALQPGYDNAPHKADIL